MKFIIPGKIKGKARPRFSKGAVYTSKDTVNYENWIKMCFIDAKNKQKYKPNLTDNIPMRIKITCEFEIPASFSKKKKEAARLGSLYPTKAPDIDNIVKAVCDAVNLIAYKDDRQIIACECTKVYGESEKLIIELEEYI